MALPTRPSCCRRSRAARLGQGTGGVQPRSSLSIRAGALRFSHALTPVEHPSRRGCRTTARPVASGAAARRFPRPRRRRSRLRRRRRVGHVAPAGRSPARAGCARRTTVGPPTRHRRVQGRAVPPAHHARLHVDAGAAWTTRPHIIRTVTSGEPVPPPPASVSVRPARVASSTPWSTLPPASRPRFPGQSLLCASRRLSTWCRGGRVVPAHCAMSSWVSGTTTGRTPSEKWRPVSSRRRATRLSTGRPVVRLGWAVTTVPLPATPWRDVGPPRRRGCARMLDRIPSGPPAPSGAPPVSWMSDVNRRLTSRRPVTVTIPPRA